MVTVDEKGRVVLPKELRERLSIRPRDKVVVRLREDGIVELYKFDELKAYVEEVADRKLSTWREEDHEATRLLERLVRRHEA